MLLKCSVECASRTAIKAVGVALCRVDEDARRIRLWVGADSNIKAVLVATEGFRTEVAAAVATGTDRCTLVLRNGVLLACHSLISPEGILVMPRWIDIRLMKTHFTMTIFRLRLFDETGNLLPAFKNDHTGILR